MFVKTQPVQVSETVTLSVYEAITFGVGRTLDRINGHYTEDRLRDNLWLSIYARRVLYGLSFVQSYQAPPDDELGLWLERALQALHNGEFDALEDLARNIDLRAVAEMLDNAYDKARRHLPTAPEEFGTGDGDEAFLADADQH